jgi:hypothetical protein
MRIPTICPSRASGAVSGLALALILSACGSSSSSSSAAGTSTQAAATTSSTTSTPAPKPRLPILTPRAGAHTGSLVTVRVSLLHARATGADPFRYVLDGRLTRLGSRRLVFRDLRPGHHRLVVMLAGDHGVHGSRAFVVRTPPPPPPPPVVTMAAPAPAPAPMAPAPAPMSR